MGLILRSAVGLSLLFLVMPIDVGEETAGQQEVGAVQALFAARDAVRDLAGFCDRQPEVCGTARAALSTILARAKESIRLAEQFAGDPAVPAADTEPAKPMPEAPLPDVPVVTPTPKPALPAPPFG